MRDFKKISAGCADGHGKIKSKFSSVNEIAISLNMNSNSCSVVVQSPA